MGWGRTLLLGDIGNRLDIADTERDIQSLRIRLSNQTGIDRNQNERLESLESENEELKLYLASLIRLLVSRGTIAREEVQSFVRLIDAEGERAG